MRVIREISLWGAAMWEHSQLAGVLEQTAFQIMRMPRDVKDQTVNRFRVRYCSLFTRDVVRRRQGLNLNGWPNEAKRKVVWNNNPQMKWGVGSDSL